MENVKFICDKKNAVKNTHCFQTVIRRSPQAVWFSFSHFSKSTRFFPLFFLLMFVKSQLKRNDELTMRNATVNTAQSTKLSFYLFRFVRL